MFHTKYKIQNTKYNFRAFTLIESLIAISILLVGILSAFTLVTKALATAPVIQDRLLASFLAQEDIENIRHTRDSNFLKILNTGSGNWLNGIQLNSTSTEPITLNHTSFVREIYVQHSSSSDHAKVDCRVSWKTKGHQYSFTAEDHLYNWINIQ